MSQTDQARVVVGLSGGVDSSVSAALLKDQGYDVVGVMLRLWSDQGVENRCCAPEAQNEARRVAGLLDIPFYVMDAQVPFYQTVVEPFVQAYAEGITPNPCLNCNKFIRWHFLLDRARMLGASFLATGHYARIKQDGRGTFQLLKNPDPDKDQTYFLHVLTQADLRQTIFPLGEYKKDQVRKLAAKYALPVASRPDSQDLCFVGQGDYRDFLQKIDPSLGKPGPILDLNGSSLGTHSGLANYTIGQRKGLQVAGPEPYYVLRKDLRENTLIIGPRGSLGRKSFLAAGVNWIAGGSPPEPFRAEIKIRYKSQAVPGTVKPLSPDRAEITLDQELPDITPGQAAVFYQDLICLGGGLIQGEDI